MSKEDIDRAVKEAEAFAAEDKKKKEDIDVRNGADQMIFQCEKAMKDMEGKISDSEKADINTKIEALKNELKSGTTESTGRTRKIVLRGFPEDVRGSRSAGTAAGRGAGYGRRSGRRIRSGRRS